MPKHLLRHGPATFPWPLATLALMVFGCQEGCPTPEELRAERRYRKAQEALFQAKLQLERENKKLELTIATRKKTEMELEHAREQSVRTSADKERWLKTAKEKEAVLEKSRREEEENRRALRLLRERINVLRR